MFTNARKCCVVSIYQDTNEILDLCRTLNIDVVSSIIQKREKPDPHTFIGKGKLDELKRWIDEVDLFVFDGNLKPPQQFRLETSLKKPCIDRIAMVLEIFDRHAGSTESKAQVALARIRYELPFIREWINKALHDDRPGFLAGGEYAIDAYYENARKQMKRIEAELDRIASERENRRRRRKERGFYLISICGYTNGGKSSLLNALSNSQIRVDDKMFSTLSTTTRRLSETGRKILLTDTVGFIRNLPPDLLDAFDATLEEIYDSSCIILILDISDNIETIAEKFSTSLKILTPRTDLSKILIVLNKIDRIDDEELQAKLNAIEEDLSRYSFFLISIKNGEGLSDLVDGILNKIGIPREIEVTMPNTEEGKRLYYWLTEQFIVIDARWNEQLVLRLEVTEDELENVRNRIEGRANISLFSPPTVSS